MDFGSNAFIMICAALVFLMTPGLAFFYGGLTRRKNVINTMAACGAYGCEQKVNVCGTVGRADFDSLS